MSQTYSCTCVRTVANNGVVNEPITDASGNSYAIVLNSAQTGSPAVAIAVTLRAPSPFSVNKGDTVNVTVG